MRGILAFLTMALLTSLAGAQELPSTIRFDHIQVPGVIQSSLTEDIIQDPYGMIWLGKNVVYRFNGREFTPYPLIIPDSAGFSQREISKLLWDKPGQRLLVGTRNFGILQYSYATDRLIPLPVKGIVPIVNDMVQDANGKVWVTSYTSGIFELRDDTLRKLDLRPAAFNPTAAFAQGNTVWIGCNNEIINLRHGEIQKRISIAPYNEYAANQIRASALEFDREGHLWIGTERDGIIVLDTVRLQLVKRFSPSKAPFFNSITRIKQDESGFFWVLTKEAGVILLNPVTNEWKQYNKTETDRRGLAGDHCTSILIDATGIVWLGTAGALNKFDRRKVAFEHINYQPNQPLSLSDDNVRGICKDSRGRILLATTGGYINVVDRTNGTVEKIKVVVPGEKEFIIPLAFQPYGADRYLLGTSHGLLLFNQIQKSFSFFKPLEKETRGYSVRQVLMRENKIFLMIHGRVLEYNLCTGESELKGVQPKLPGVTHIALDSTDRLWLGTHRGIAYKAWNESEFHQIDLRKQKFRADSSGFLILSIHHIQDEIWVNAFNHGIFIFDDGEAPTFKRKLTINEGLPDNTVYATLPDAAGQIWIANNSGLSLYQPRLNRFIHYTVSEGLQDEEFNRLAFYQDTKGEIILGGINGINVFQPSQIQVSTRTPAVHPLFLRHNKGNEFASISLLDTARTTDLPYDQNTIQVSFFVSDYSDPIRYKTYFRLEPIDQEWMQTDILSSSTYTNLPSGDYTFHLKAVGIGGETSMKSSRIHIGKPFWQTLWFIALATGSLTAAIYVFVHSRIQKDRRDKMKLEALLTIRTQEIERSREELENLNRKKDLIFSILSHDLRSPLTTLKGFLGLLIENSEALPKEDLKRFAASIRHSVSTSLDLIDNTLFWSLSQTGNIQAHPSSVSLPAILDKINSLYSLTIEKKKLDLHIAPMDGLFVHGDENMIYVVLRNLISNAIKFTPEGKSIHVAAVRQGALVVIQVRDQGVGMSAEEIEKIFQLDHPVVKKGTSSEKGTGLGLLLCKKFVEMNHGQLLIRSSPDEGSEFTIMLPCA